MVLNIFKKIQITIKAAFLAGRFFCIWWGIIKKAQKENKMPKDECCLVSRALGEWPKQPAVPLKLDQKFIEWIGRVEQNRTLKVFVAPQGISLPCGCKTEKKSDKERRVVREGSNYYHIGCWQVRVLYQYDDRRIIW